MRKHLLFFFFLCYAWLAHGVYAGASPMVERHIFSPEPEEKGAYRSAGSRKLQKEILFTGVVRSSEGNWAVIRANKDKGGEDAPVFRRVGDEINGMTIKKIGRNYLILIHEGKEVRLNLYNAGKVRSGGSDDSGDFAVTRQESYSGPMGTSSRSGRSVSEPRTNRRFSNTTTSEHEALKGGAGGLSKQPSPFSQKKTKTDSPPNPFQTRSPSSGGSASGSTGTQTPPNPFTTDQNGSSPFPDEYDD